LRHRYVVSLTAGPLYAGGLALENSPGPGKRPLNNVCPLIIRMPGRDVALGARGIVGACAGREGCQGFGGLEGRVQRLVDEMKK